MGPSDSSRDELTCSSPSRDSSLRGDSSKKSSLLEHKVEEEEDKGDDDDDDDVSGEADDVDHDFDDDFEEHVDTPSRHRHARPSTEGGSSSRRHASRGRSETTRCRMIR